MIGDLFVTGMVVPELERAMKESTKTLGVEFTPVQESPLQMRTERGVDGGYAWSWSTASSSPPSKRGSGVGS